MSNPPTSAIILQTSSLILHPSSLIPHPSAFVFVKQSFLSQCFWIPKKPEITKRLQKQIG